MAKTFKSAFEDSSYRLQVCKYTGDEHVTLWILGRGSDSAIIAIDPSDAPALALAILEAAGVEPVDHKVTGLGKPNWLEGIAHGLKLHIEHDAKRTAEAEAQAKLEAEALELLNVRRKFEGIEHVDALDDVPKATRNLWLAVARKARELNKEEGQ